MNDTVFLSPEAQRTRLNLRRSPFLERLPPELEEEAVKRVAGLSLATIFMGVVAFVLLWIFPSVQLGPRSTRLAVYGPFMALSIAIFVLSRRKLLSPARIVELSLGYKVLGAAAMAVMVNTFPWPKEVMAPTWSPVAVWVLLFPIVVPGPSLRTLVSSAIALLMEPIGVYWLVRQGHVEAPSHEALVRRFFPSVISLVLSVYVSRVVFGLGSQLKAARELGSYRLVERLGSGGMGEVWRAKHRMLARPAAVKLIHPEAFRGDGSSFGNAQRRFEREAQATAALRSPHTVGIFDFGVSSDGCFYYVMELLDGMDLDALVRLDGPQPPARVVHLLQQACHSLHEAHKAGLVHRDIKPANLFVCRYGADFDFLKVLDFGLVAERKKDKLQPSLTAENTVTGTPAFMAPELVTGEHPVDGRTDLYALGCVAYWLLTGKLVFAGDTAMRVILQHATATPEAPSARLGRELPAELDEIVLDCLSKEPDRRPRSARELSRRLEALRLADAWTEEQAAAWWEAMAP